LAGANAVEAHSGLLNWFTFVSRGKNDFEILNGQFSVWNISGRHHRFWRAKWASDRFCEPALLEQSSPMKQQYWTSLSDLPNGLVLGESRVRFYLFYSEKYLIALD
jgi:hypothetical protein